MPVPRGFIPVKLRPALEIVGFFARTIERNLQGLVIKP